MPALGAPGTLPAGGEARGIPWGEPVGFQLDELSTGCANISETWASLGKHRADTATATSKAPLPAAAEQFVVLSSRDLSETKLCCIGLGLHKFTVCSAAYICSPSNLPLDGTRVYSVSCFNRKINVPVSVCY